RRQVLVDVSGFLSAHVPPRRRLRAISGGFHGRVRREPRRHESENDRRSDGRLHQQMNTEELVMNRWSWIFVALSASSNLACGASNDDKIQGPKIQAHTPVA